MSRRSRIRAWSHALLFVAALAATVPAVHWCPRDWDEIAPDAFLRCAAVSSVSYPGCALTYAGPVPPCAPVCARGGTCADAAPDACTACPLGEDAPPAQGTGPHRGRAYLLGDAAAHRALRHEPPRLAPSTPAIVTLAASLPAPAAPPHAPFEREAPTRPPPDAPHAPPPARAPPLDA